MSDVDKEIDKMKTNIADSIIDAVLDEAELENGCSRCCDEGVINVFDRSNLIEELKKLIVGLVK